MLCDTYRVQYNTQLFDGFLNLYKRLHFIFYSFLWKFDVTFGEESSNLMKYKKAPNKLSMEPINAANMLDEEGTPVSKEAKDELVGK